MTHIPILIAAFHLMIVPTAQTGPPAQASSSNLEIPLKFSHRVHLNSVGMSCEDCHRGLAETDLAGPENNPKMADCLLCHVPEKAALSECKFCHPDNIDLRPAGHRTGTFFDNHPKIVEKQSDASDCTMCHTPGYNPCAQCH